VSASLRAALAGGLDLAKMSASFAAASAVIERALASSSDEGSDPSSGG